MSLSAGQCRASTYGQFWSTGAACAWSEEKRRNCLKFKIASVNCTARFPGLQLGRKCWSARVNPGPARGRRRRPVVRVGRSRRQVSHSCIGAGRDQERREDGLASPEAPLHPLMMCCVQPGMFQLHPATTNLGKGEKGFLEISCPQTRSWFYTIIPFLKKNYLFECKWS